MSIVYHICVTMANLYPGNQTIYYIEIQLNPDAETGIISTSPHSRSSKSIAVTKFVRNLTKCRCFLRGSLRFYVNVKFSAP